MAVGYWHHRGHKGKHKFIGFTGAYHGDTIGAMSVGYSDLFHRPYEPLTFPTFWAPSTDALRAPLSLINDSMREAHEGDEEVWPSENPFLMPALREFCLGSLETMLKKRASEVAAVVIEPVMQGAAGMVAQPPGFLEGVARLARKYGVLLIADEVAVGFGRTGTLLACEQDRVCPDILCLAKGITGGYLPLAATLTTDEVFHAFTGELKDRKTLYHGHTYTGNPLACAAAIASLKRFDSHQVLAHAAQSAQIIEDQLQVLHDADRFPHVIDVRQRGVMVGIELGKNRHSRDPFDFSKRAAANLCMKMRDKGLILRPLGDVLVLMPAPAMPHAMIQKMLDIVIETLEESRIRY
jgi:adenosylmethionine-8-amino-7-oxononanoate aminotransferase